MVKRETKLFKWEREREESQKMEIGYVKYRRENDRKCQTSLLKSYSTTFSKDLLMLRSAKGGHTKYRCTFQLFFRTNYSRKIFLKIILFDSFVTNYVKINLSFWSKLIQIEIQITNKFLTPSIFKFYLKILVISYLAIKNHSIYSYIWTTQIIN